MLYRKKSSMVTYLFSAYFIPVYVSFIIVKTCGFVMGFVSLGIYFDYKTVFDTIFNIKILKTKSHFKKT